MKCPTYEEVIEMIENGDLDSEYADHIMENSSGIRVICNGDTLIEAMEDGYLMESFAEAYLEKIHEDQ